MIGRSFVDCEFIAQCSLLFIIIICEKKIDGKHVGNIEDSDGNIANVKC